MLSVDLPSDLERRIDSVIQGSGQNRSVFVQRAIVAYLETLKQRESTQSTDKRRLGEAKDLVVIKPDFDELPEDFMAHFS